VSSRRASVAVQYLVNFRCDGMALKVAASADLLGDTADARPMLIEPVI